jgi:hypothetical protein
MRVGKTAENIVGTSAVALFAGISLATSPAFFLSAAVWICAAHAELASIPSFQLGSVQIRISGLAIAGLLCGATIFIAAHFREASEVLAKGLRPFLLLLVFSALRALDAPDKAMAVKEVLLLAPPLAIGVLAWISLAHGFAPSLIEKQLLICPLLVAIFLLLQAITGQAAYDDEGLASSLGKGPIALFCLPVLALALSFWRYAKESKWPIFAMLLSLGLILVTVERMAIVVALLVLTPLRFIAFERAIIRNTLSWTLVSCLAALIVLQAPNVRYRFFEHKENPAFDGEETIINTSGRTTIWLLTIEDALYKPFVGQGTGSAEVFIRGALPEIDQPHNEYLRIWHDLGVIGLFLMLIAWFGRLIHHFKMWSLFDNTPERARPHMAAALATLAMTLSFVTDNALIFIPAQVPVFLLFAIADRSTGREAAAFAGKSAAENPA